MGSIQQKIKMMKSWVTGKGPDADYNICPVCHKKDQVISIRYGKPNRELMEKAEKGLVKLGGCDMGNRPSLYCKRDDLEF